MLTGGPSTHTHMHSVPQRIDAYRGWAWGGGGGTRGVYTPAPCRPGLGGNRVWSFSVATKPPNHQPNQGGMNTPAQCPPGLGGNKGSLFSVSTKPPNHQPYHQITNQTTNRPPNHQQSHHTTNLFIRKLFFILFLYPS